MTQGPALVSLLPSATEMICALGLTDRLAGVTHECDHPAAVRSKPRVVRAALPIETMSDREIDEAVSARLGAGLGLYILDVELIQKLRPDIIVTQSLCDVCAPSHNEMAQLIAELHYRPRVLFQTPHRIADVLDCLVELGAETGTQAVAERIVAQAHDRLDEVARRTSAATHRPRVFCMEWLEPVYCSGHWVPEMVRLAGGEDILAREGQDSVRIDWDRVRASDPEILIFMPCGFDLAKALERTPTLTTLADFHALTAVRTGRVYAVDANSYFARPGPRIIDGAELMAHLVHPELFPWTGSANAYARLPLAAAGSFTKKEALSAS